MKKWGYLASHFSLLRKRENPVKKRDVWSPWHMDNLTGMFAVMQILI
jgi:hypothetical protein